MTNIEILERAMDYVGVKYINGVEQAYMSPILVGAIHAGLTAIRAQQEAEKNDPLTLDELWDMCGEPVWVALEIDGMSQIHAYAIVDSECECVKGLKYSLPFEDYGAWTAYRRPPEKEV